ncbi:unnamed protein product [Rhizophagus irregularis]|nr:unnamed protein product [Rhizophagus irregularis]
MDEIKLSDEQRIKECYKIYGLCETCKQPKTSHNYCRHVIHNIFNKNFKNWTSGNHDVDEFIQKAQLKAEDKNHIVEWINMINLENVEYLAKGGFGTTFKAVWKDGPIWNCDDNQWERKR